MGGICLPAAGFGSDRPRPLNDPAETAVFLESFMPKELSGNHVPGAVLVIVKDGELFLVKGYGYADIAAGKPVIPERTLFRIGSVTECVTATAVMQLVRAGKLQPDEDVNCYLGKFQLQPAFLRPVTIRHLLTHTGGFEEKLIGSAVRSRTEVTPLAVWLAANMPFRVFAPGDVVSASLQGYCLLGCAVGSVSGLSFEQYMQQYVFRPLEMGHTSFDPPPEARGDVAVGYESLGSSHRPATAVWLNVAPAAGIYSTGVDMARFLAAQDESGTARRTAILAPEALREMHRKQFSHDSYLPGMAFGYHESYHFNRRGLFRAGGLPGYSSLLYLMPDERLGIFVANNGYSNDMNWEVLDGLIRRYFPSAPEKISPPGDFSSRASRFTGSYQHVRHSRHTIEKLAMLRSGQTYVSANDDGTLNIYGSRFAEVDPMTFRRVDGFERVYFRAGRDGKITHLFFDQEAHQRLDWYQTSLVRHLLLWFFILTFASSFFGWGDQRPAWDVGESHPPTNRTARRTLLFAEAVCALNIAFLIGLAVVFVRVGAGEICFDLPRFASVILRMPMLTSALALALPVMVVTAWRKGYWTRVKRVHFTLIGLAGVGFIPWLHSWNLLL